MAGCYILFHKQLGDLVLLEPALARLRAHHGAPLVVLTRVRHAPLLDLIDGAQFQIGPQFIPRKHLYCFDHQSKSALRAAFTPAWHKCCIIPEKREVFWYHRPVFSEVIVSEIGDRYAAEYSWAQTPVPTSSPFRPPRLNRPQDSWKPPGTGDTPYVLLNATSAWRHKSWMPDRWAQVLRVLHAEHGFHFVLTSASTDWQIQNCRDIESLTGPYVHSLASGTSLEQFLWLCANASLVLTVDGAASHLAAAFGRRSLTLFGRTSVHRWHFPTERNIALKAPPSRDGICRLRDLDVPTVMRAALELCSKEI